jgi:N utilization substance protein B
MKHIQDEFATARQAALLVLVALDISTSSVEQALIDFPASLADRETLADRAVEVRAQWKEVEKRVRGVHEAMEALNDEIRTVSPRWKIERMAPVDRSILRLGFWEILHGKVAPVVAINGCVELAKLYGEKGTPAFVNGLMDQLCQNHGIAIK